MAISFLALLAVWLIFAVVGVLATAFWIWMLVDCVIHEPPQGNDKLVWILLIILLPFIGSLLYFFIRRSNRPVTAGAMGDQKYFQK
jgi:uncharacterized RDD family membrane protein YckC